MKIVAVEDLRLSARAARFQGEDDAAVSFFITRSERGQGPDQHLHPYAEVFIVETGEATFLVDGERRVVGAGHIVIVPPETPHGFKNERDEVLNVIGIHPSPQVQQTDL
jgi:mannose-6-phosphate isomerase-like protein (cupin superfamily)